MAHGGHPFEALSPPFVTETSQKAPPAPKCVRPASAVRGQPPTRREIFFVNERRFREGHPNWFSVQNARSPRPGGGPCSEKPPCFRQSCGPRRPRDGGHEPWRNSFVPETRQRSRPPSPKPHSDRTCVQLASSPQSSPLERLPQCHWTNRAHSPHREPA